MPLAGRLAQCSGADSCRHAISLNRHGQLWHDTAIEAVHRPRCRPPCCAAISQCRWRRSGQHDVSAKRRCSRFSRVNKPLFRHYHTARMYGGPYAERGWPTELAVFITGAGNTADTSRWSNWPISHRPRPPASSTARQIRSIFLAARRIWRARCVTVVTAVCDAIFHARRFDKIKSMAVPATAIASACPA